jgi:His-Xaa-Ser system protein HxsD
MGNLQEGSRLSCVSSSEMSLEFDPAIYHLSAIKKAAYKFGDRFHIQLLTIEGGWVRVGLKPKVAMESPEFLAGEFCNEVLDQELREVVAEETQPVRDLLLAQAFSATSLIDALGDDGDYHADPKQILGPDLSPAIQAEEAAR